MASSAARQRVLQERKAFRKDHPIGFFAKPRQNKDATVDLMTWDCGIPGKPGTPWEGGVYPVTLVFGHDYPAQPPLCSLPPGFFHPNVFGDGEICLSIINGGEDGAWTAGVSVKQILLGIQDLLDTPNEKSPAQLDAFTAFVKNKNMYAQRVRQEALKYSKEKS